MGLKNALDPIVVFHYVVKSIILRTSLHTDHIQYLLTA